MENAQENWQRDRERKSRSGSGSGSGRVGVAGADSPRQWSENIKRLVPMSAT